MRIVCALIAAALAGGAALAQEPGIRTVATVQEVMNDMVVPASSAIFQAVGLPPADADAWAALARDARVLAESGNLLLLGDRVADTDEWTLMARAQVDAAATALDAIGARDVAALGAASEAVLASCTACHARYM